MKREHVVCIGVCAFFALMLSLPQLHRAQTIMLPMLSTPVRTFAAESAKQLQYEGLWMVNVEPLQIQKEDDTICVTWKYQYQRKGETLPPRIKKLCRS